MPSCYVVEPLDTAAVPVHRIAEGDLAGVLSGMPPAVRRWAEANGFKASAGQILLVPGEDGAPAAVLFGLGKPTDRAAQPLLAGRLAGLPAGTYAFAETTEADAVDRLAFGLGAYRFERYVTPKPAGPRLAIPAGAATELARIVDAVTLVRDLVNTPSNDLGPPELAAAVRAVGERHGAEVREVEGAALAAGFPLVQAVGQGSDRPPRLVDVTWGRADAPKVTLVGKGVVFDTGGLDIKTGSLMSLMKKDMGGAAHVTALAGMIMDAGLDIRLRVIVPIVENAVSGRSFRPGDVFRSRKGLTVEIGDTDAEGRLILADALALADEEAPDLLVDLATLTGSARVALGPDVAPIYTGDDGLAADLAAASAWVADPLWRMPLVAAYDSMLASKVADVNNITVGSFAGSITAALFLARFVEKAKAWLHADIYAWTPTAKAGKPDGGEAQVIRALYAVLAARYPARS